jgi:hypothetical protein
VSIILSFHFSKLLLNRWGSCMRLIWTQRFNNNFENHKFSNNFKKLKDEEKKSKFEMKHFSFLNIQFFFFLKNFDIIYNSST